MDADRNYSMAGVERYEVICFDPSREVAVAINFVGKIDLELDPGVCRKHVDSYVTPYTVRRD